MARRPGGGRRSGPAAPRAGWRTAAAGSQQEHEAPRRKDQGGSGAHDHQVYAAVGIYRDTAPCAARHNHKTRGENSTCGDFGAERHVYCGSCGYSPDPLTLRRVARASYWAECRQGRQQVGSETKPGFRADAAGHHHLPAGDHVHRAGHQPAGRPPGGQERR